MTFKSLFKLRTTWVAKTLRLSLRSVNVRETVDNLKMIYK